MQTLNIIPRKRIKMPNDSGLYLVTDISFNQETKELEYWVKVGLSIELRSRINNYYTHNPSVLIIDYYIITRKDNPNVKIQMAVAEKACHTQLKQIALGQIQQEWFKISKKDYNLISKQKFAYFNI